MCIKKRCTKCVNFNKSKDISLNCGNFQIANHVKNFLVNYFSANYLTKQFFKLDIADEVQEKNPLYVYDGKMTMNQAPMKKLITLLKGKNAVFI